MVCMVLRKRTVYVYVTRDYNNIINIVCYNYDILKNTCLQRFKIIEINVLELIFF